MFGHTLKSGREYIDAIGAGADLTKYRDNVLLLDMMEDDGMPLPPRLLLGKASADELLKIC